MRSDSVVPSSRPFSWISTTNGSLAEIHPARGAAGVAGAGGRIYPLSKNWTTSNLHAGRFTISARLGGPQGLLQGLQVHRLLSLAARSAIRLLIVGAVVAAILLVRHGHAFVIS